MEINFWMVALAIIVAVIVIILLILKNKKDLKEFENKLNNQDIDPEHHKEERI